MANGARGKRGGTRSDPLSRDERRYYGASPGFAPLDVRAMVACPDCRDNELSPPTNRRPIKPRKVVGPQRGMFGCGTCEGRGVVPAEQVKDQIDPYMMPRRG